jgi:hypothetical protein
MGELPPDLVAIPTQPWDERPAELPLDAEEVRTALWLNKGNISLAANQLKVSSSRLRNFVHAKPRLLAEQREAREQLADRAEQIVDEALNDPADAGRRDGMAKFILNSEMARGRGLSARPSPTVNVSANKANMVISWLEPGQVPPGHGTTIDEQGELVND